MAAAAAPHVAALLQDKCLIECLSSVTSRVDPRGEGGSAPPAKRGRPFGSGNNSASAAASAADSAAPSTLLGPSLHVHNSFTDQNNKRIVLALQSGLKSELTWALNTLTLLSFKEKDDMRKDATPLAKIPSLLDALLQVVCAANLVLHLRRNVQRIFVDVLLPVFVVEIITLFNLLLWYCCVLIC